MSDEMTSLKWYTAVRVDVVDMSPNAGPPAPWRKPKQKRKGDEAR